MSDERMIWLTIMGKGSGRLTSFAELSSIMSLHKRKGDDDANESEVILRCILSD